MTLEQFKVLLRLQLKLIDVAIASQELLQHNIKCEREDEEFLELMLKLGKALDEITLR
jgi:hypothetical protein